MTKLEFINALGQQLHPLPPAEVQGILNYYAEAIDDRMEDGMTEAAAIESLGPISELTSRHLQMEPDAPAAPEPPEADIPQPKRRFTPGVIVLLVLGSPIWLSLGAAALSVALALYITVWALLGSLAIVVASLVLAGIIGSVSVVLLGTTPNTTATRLLCLGVCLLCLGAGALLLPAALRLIRGFARLHGRCFRRIRKERA